MEAWSTKKYRKPKRMRDMAHQNNREIHASTLVEISNY